MAWPSEIEAAVVKQALPFLAASSKDGEMLERPEKERRPKSSVGYQQTRLPFSCDAAA